MTHLLHLDSSARPTSFSRQVSARIAAAWRAQDLTGDYTYRDLAADPVPFIGEGWTLICDRILERGITDLGRYAEVVDSDETRSAWSVVEPLLAELVAADVVLIGAPMYNFSVPAALKAWIDQVTFPKMSLAGRSFVVAVSRGGSYLPGAPRAPYDYQERYLRDFFAGHYAVEDVTFVRTELTNARVDPALAGRREAQRESHERALDQVDDVVAALAARRLTTAGERS